MANISLEQVRRKIDEAPSEQRLSIIQNFICQIDSPEQRSLAESMFFLGQELSTLQQRENIVVLIHGIMTHAVWQERLMAKLKSEADIVAFPIGYDFLDILRFWCPFFTRKGPIDKVLHQLRVLRSEHPNADISAVAHSFGTYIMSQILLDNTDIKIHRIQLCGSIISRNFQWDQLKGRIKGIVVNDAGSRDYWPVFASLFSWGYGASGTFGFKNVLVKDRFYDCGHSDFFEDEHMRKYWIPLLIDGQVVPSDWSQSRPSPNVVISFLNWLPLKILIAIGIFVWALSKFNIADKFIQIFKIFAGN
ncbi:MAG TPA: alpha/beta fold hydrolase [Gallionellaceae bacterium]|nr:alpha/beta fold hydrolase [Gallionellaceae bacterium]